jgi:acetolactate synthase-1/2/3 large subunit
MNGAESLLSTLIGSGIKVCFANPGTSEMHFVAALDKMSGMRAILCLFEGVVIGAADGYGRMAEKPACTLLHLGPGLANGLANLHNARRAATPIVNIVDTAWSEADRPAPALPRPQLAAADAEAVNQAAAALQTGKRSAILIRGSALKEAGLKAAGRISGSTGRAFFAIP